MFCNFAAGDGVGVEINFISESSEGKFVSAENARGFFFGEALYIRMCVVVADIIRL